VLTPFLFLNYFRISPQFVLEVKHGSKGLFCFQFVFMLYFLFLKLLGNKCMLLKMFLTVSLLRQTLVGACYKFRSKKEVLSSHSLPWKLCSLLVCSTVECPYGMLVSDEVICLMCALAVCNDWGRNKEEVREQIGRNLGPHSWSHVCPFCWQFVTWVWKCSISALGGKSSRTSMGLPYLQVWECVSFWVTFKLQLISWFQTQFPENWHWCTWYTPVPKWCVLFKTAVLF
jgi:hypothetical protein